MGLNQLPDGHQRSLTRLDKAIINEERRARGEFVREWRSDSEGAKQARGGEPDLRIPDISARLPLDRPADRRAASWTKTFRKSAPSKRPSPDQLRRQDSVLQCAWRSLGASRAVIAFLNTHHEELGRVPLHLALESDEGLMNVERLLGEIALETTDRDS